MTLRDVHGLEYRDIAATTGFVASHRQAAAGGPGGPGGPRPPSPGMLAERMSRDLGLSADQRARLEVVLQAGGRRLDRFHGTTGEQFEALRRELDLEIEKVLTPISSNDSASSVRAPAAVGPRPRHADTGRAGSLLAFGPADG